MMMFKTHIAFSLLLGLFILDFYPQLNKFAFLFFVLLATPLPDIDNPNSKVGRIIKPFSWLTKKLFGHRGILHSLPFPLFLYVVFVYILDLWLVGFAVLVGYLSHLLADALTLEGVNLFYPFNTKIQGFIRTGGVFEYFLFLVFSIACVVKFIF